MPIVRIREQSPLARLATLFMGSRRMALVWGPTIHLYGCEAGLFLQNRRWLRHEIEHLEQFRRMGTASFLLEYLLQWVQNGYYNIPAEKEARAAEEQPFPEWWLSQEPGLRKEYGLPV